MQSLVRSIDNDTGLRVTVLRIDTLDDGAVNDPSLAFRSKQDLGVFKTDSNGFGIAENGTSVVEMNPTEVRVLKKLRVDYNGGNTQLDVSRADGNEGGSLRVQDGTTTGLFGTSINDVFLETKSGNSCLHVITNDDCGVLQRGTQTTFQQNFQIFGSDGANYQRDFNFATIVNGGRLKLRSVDDSANPAYAFEQKANTGMYLAGGTDVGLSQNGVQIFNGNENQVDIIPPLEVSPGSLVNLGVRALTDTDTGYYWKAADTWNVAAGGADALEVSDKEVLSYHSLRSNKFTDVTTTPYTVLASDYILKASGSASTLDLPTFANNIGREWYIYSVGVVVTINAQAGEVFLGEGASGAAITLSSLEAVYIKVVESTRALAFVSKDPSLI